MLWDFPVFQQTLKFKETNSGNVRSLNERHFARGVERERKLLFELALGKFCFWQCERHVTNLMNFRLMVKLEASDDYPSKMKKARREPRFLKFPVFT
jgi:hypothetical protein